MAPTTRTKAQKEAQNIIGGGGKAVYCICCGKAYGRQKGYFPNNHSQLYKGVGYIPVCSDCIDEIYDELVEKHGDKRAAMARFCMKFDLYWNPSIFEDVEAKAVLGMSWPREYIRKANHSRYSGRGFEETLDEEIAVESKVTKLSRAAADAAFAAPMVDEDDEPPDPELVAFWGSGFTRSFYAEIEARYQEWTKGVNKLEPNVRAIYKQICILEATINRDTANGKPVDKSINALNNLLGSMKLKPAQQKDNEIDPEFESLTLGMGIRRYEDFKPVPEVDPQFKDVDGIVRYISIWFLGHLCKMLNIRNTYCQLYEEEMEKLRVSAPEFEDEDDEEIFQDIFGNKGDDL